MKMEISTLSMYEVVTEIIVIYMTYPEDKIKRDQAFARFLTSWINNNSEIDERASHITKFAREYAVLFPLAQNYKDPNKGYSFNKLAIVANLLITLFRLDVSNVSVSMYSAYGFTLAMDKKNKLGKTKISERRLKEYWMEYRSVAHIAMFFLLHGRNEVTQEEYPKFISSLYILQEKYKKIISKNNNFSYEIWELPSLSDLNWSLGSREIPQSFYSKMIKSIEIQPFNEKELLFLEDSKKFVRNSDQYKKIVK
ncbi:hypothetical protein GFH30_04940 [Acinetobacter wanghuae]|uniref:DUF2785 domain-containing protein n=1 Tax=Acinetobacter wanghuae TaxID=2662362 RepID=A0A5Q0P223_9GAMM|nr:hypothetical protein [Acinetobacter wanghuae]MQW93384.1 hypothetical protein [Acinetobacter wanghuae]QGA10776.1 hypothetical protein GFH30_04940 [Acinetobacter wanghuae]